jgi:hypothetical protein
LRRDKAPLAGTPQFQTVRRTGVEPIVPCEELSKYVDPRKVPATKPVSELDFWLNLRPVVLNHWLQFSSVTN